MWVWTWVGGRGLWRSRHDPRLSAVGDLPLCSLGVLAPQPPLAPSLPHLLWGESKKTKTPGAVTTLPTPLVGGPGAPSPLRRDAHLSELHSGGCQQGLALVLCDCPPMPSGRGAAPWAASEPGLSGARGRVARDRAGPSPSAPSPLQMSLQTSLLRRRLGTRAAYKVLSSVTAEGETHPER